MLQCMMSIVTSLMFTKNPENQLLFKRLDKKGNYYERFWGGYNNDLFNYGMLMGVTANTEETIALF